MWPMTKGQSGGAVFWLCFAAMAAVGVAVEIGIGQMVHEREAWDSSYYWLFGLPAMIAGAFLGGFFARRKPVLIGYAPFLGQLLAMVAKTGSGYMLPLGVFFMGVIGACAVAAAFIGVLAGKRVLGTAPIADRR